MYAGKGRGEWMSFVLACRGLHMRLLCHVYGIGTGKDFGPGRVDGCGNLFEAECALLFTLACALQVCVCACDFLCLRVSVLSVSIRALCIIYLRISICDCVRVCICACIFLCVYVWCVCVYRRAFGFATVSLPAAWHSCSRLALLQFHWLNPVAGFCLRLVLGKSCV